MELQKLLELGCGIYSKPIYPKRQNLICAHKTAFDNILKQENTISEIRRLGINECELFAYLFLIGFGSHEIQNPLRCQTKPNKFIENIILHLDNFLLKCERTNSEVLYRQDDYSDVAHYKEEQLVSFNNYFVASLDDFDNSLNIIWVVTPRLENTKGRVGYKIYDHGDEKQITFERGARFVINRMEKPDNMTYIYCNEIE
ncbi:hypothetical protein SAMN05421740_10412 [Parapedobacter koreensis]|uniref:ADP-ribosyltransferase exoenzyme n=2 Tax=Parapedobacter koreensis TaxID=332977 RepID=A0A1H7NK26_9SPHI|nr:hypothetical protein SAMN05421740_10412 [Parapedobacter koreensis]